MKPVNINGVILSEDALGELRFMQTGDHLDSGV